ncbi:Hypothetical_protein [Hexamita inflata]|uniref:Hypothetical_protein n=1 Tax=Hexamita inflata TaxID=28002 RepID=A0AA86V259_9EUKA|nr:Hypothetical protein HINF_LOCUS65399 [Hexamita inflata]
MLIYVIQLFPLAPSRNKPRLQPQYNPILWFFKLNHGEDTGCKRPKWKLIQIRFGVYRRHGRSHNSRQNPTNYQRNDCFVQRNVFRSKYRKMRVHSPQLLQQIRNRELFRLLEKQRNHWQNKSRTISKRNSMDTQNQTFQTRINFYSSANASQAPVITDLSSMSRNTALRTSSFIKKLTSS